MIGVVADTKLEKLRETSQPTAYLPITQVYADQKLLVKARGDPATLAPAIRASVREASALSNVRSISRLDDLVDASIAEDRFRTTLIDLFGIIATVLAAIGLYGLTSRMVARRMREAGIRIALGASVGAVCLLVVRRTMTLVAAGAVLGAALAVPATRALAPYLFGVRPVDAATCALTAAVLVVVGLFASGLPALRLGRVTPTTILRSD